MEYYEIGKIINTHGIKGELKVENYSSLDYFKKGCKIYIGNGKNIEQINSNRLDKGFEYITLKGLLDINLVLKYKGQVVYIKEEELLDLNDDEYYVYELLDKEVYNEDGLYRGKVVDVREVPQGQLLEIESKNLKKSLIPFRKEFVVEISDKIIIHEIEGLICE